MRIGLRRAARVILPCLLAVILNGCTKESQEGDQTIFTYAFWVPGAIAGAGVLSTAVGLLIRKSVERLGWGLIIVGPIAIFGFAPCMLTDKVVVNNDRFTQRTGFWFAQTVHEVAFGEVSQMVLVAEEKVGRRGRRSTSYYLDCYRRTGATERVPINDLMKQGANDKILSVARARNIPIIDNR